MKKITIPASSDQLDHVLDFVNQGLNELDCPKKTQLQIDIAVEEIFVNIAHYSYETMQGDTTISIEPLSDHSGLLLTFEDSGKPYNPLEQSDPDITLSASEREIGGLGIFMVKKTMDNLSYLYENGNNILTIKKSW
ncbi:MAG: ATP-binding protein [Clostridia bacterium]|nr:ATP-binding protein [Clostridia bacterium]